MTNVGKKVGKLKPSYATGGNVKWYSHCEKKNWGFLKKVKQTYKITQQIHSWYVPKRIGNKCYLFGCTRSLLRQAGSFFFFFFSSCSTWNLIP